MNTRVQLAYVVPIVLVVLLASVWATSYLCYEHGVSETKKLYRLSATKDRVEVPASFASTLRDAVLRMRAGDTSKALSILKQLEVTYPNISSLTYLVAMAAMQDGDITLAEQKVTETIDKRERVSDALALQAVLESQKAGQPGFSNLGDPKARAEGLLRRAILADAANPFSYIELSTLLRYQGRTDEAADLLKSARAMLNPVDSHTVVDVTSELIRLEGLPENKLPDLKNEIPSTPVGAFGTAYVAIRKKNFALAARILDAIRSQMSPDLFYYLVNDPALRKSAREPELARFFQ